MNFKVILWDKRSNNKDAKTVHENLGDFFFKSSFSLHNLKQSLNHMNSFSLYLCYLIAIPFWLWSPISK